ncbi:MAG TPA: hypothetical protein VMF53_11920 [Alphaproteobacteria bacterium]|nr:hypothetical protein [Alphaproteobacteria bacterium]
MIAELCLATGWTWREVESEMTLPRLEAIGRAWRRHPPASRLLAAYFGYQAPGGASPPPARGDLAELVALAGGIGGGIRGGKG